MNRSLASSTPAATAPSIAGPTLQQQARWRPALVLAVLSLLLFGLLYALAATGITRPLFSEQATGSLLLRDGQVRGSRLLAQAFSGDGYFQPRPSAVAYDPMAAGGSNLARGNPVLQQRVQQAIAAVAAREGVTAAQVPADLVTTSGSGVDPDISPAAAQLQIARVARSRRMDTAQVAALVQAHTEGRQWGVFGQPRVNVVSLNLALDAAAARR